MNKLCFDVWVCANEVGQAKLPGHIFLFCTICIPQNLHTDLRVNYPLPDSLKKFNELNPPVIFIPLDFN